MFQIRAFILLFVRSNKSSPYEKEKMMGKLPSLMTKLCTCIIGRENMKDKYIKNRMKLCLFAIILLWVTSLKNALLISSIMIPVPELDSIYSSCATTYSIVNEESKYYSDCVRYQLEECKRKLFESMLSETQLINVLQTRNRNIVQKAKAIEKKCTNAFIQARFIIKRYLDTGNALPTENESSTCNKEEKENLWKDLGDLSSVRSLALGLSEDFGLDSMSTFEKMNANSKEIVSYSKGYISNFTLKTQGQVNEYAILIKSKAHAQDFSSSLSSLKESSNNLLQCVSPRSLKYGKCQAPGVVYGAQQQISSAVGKVNVAAIQFQQKLEEYRGKVVVYKNNVHQAYVRSKDFYDRKFLKSKDNKYISYFSYKD